MNKNKITFKQYLVLYIIFVLGFVAIGLGILHQWSTQGGI